MPLGLLMTQDTICLFKTSKSVYEQQRPEMFTTLQVHRLPFFVGKFATSP